MTGIYPSARPSLRSHSHNENVGYRTPYFCLDIHDVHCYSCRSFLYFLSHFSTLFFTPSSLVLFRVSPFFPSLSPALPFLASSFGGLYGHETHPDKRHVSGPSNENVADATRFRWRSMPADVYCYYSRYIHRERITLAEKSRLASNNFSRVCFTGTSSRRTNQKQPLDWSLKKFITFILFPKNYFTHRVTNKFRIK